MQLDTYLHFNGNCEAALNFYARCFGAKIDFSMKYAGSPVEPQVPAEWRDKILHASIKLGNQTLMACDVPPTSYQGPPRSFALAIGTKDGAETDRIFHALAEGGQVTMPPGETFFSPRFGMLTDRFGVRWMVVCAPATPGA
ncbi:MAG TPA: VOC family protein [Terriglobales bacterium]|nr:VOC family protein [Terriglobales bacterium]